MSVQCNDGNTALDVARMYRGACKRLLRLLLEYVEEEGEIRTLLGMMMTTRMADPVELSYQCIKRGSGDSGDVFLAQDGTCSLPTKFAVKMVKLSERSDGSNSVCSVFNIECCMVWIHKSCFDLAQVLTILHNFLPDSQKGFIISKYHCLGFPAAIRGCQ
jgi:hypothetical protein